MRVCLPDPADTVPALATGVTFAARARSAKRNPHQVLFDAHLGIIARSWAAPEQ